ncbi:hypothetical protein FPSE_08049 [Fusarium pseudograminearum CS3096]|uniref:Rhodopsin domain-containing protein n=1 Tax=Fusarium pseudograminearum (strain CS3096) TaxID=1028729 RepID=K3UIT0_FUSPC|nr:hypothetical protein FPSE_08049 [Fusarium pseudograminearum CS3096]EKJ71781.1 hypothetical protein FPSE_08049 [Fusarium pseudograminearum CS3096]
MEWTLISLSTLVIAARIWLRLGLQKQRLLGSDVWMTCAWAMGIITASFCITYVHMGVMEDGIDPGLTNFDASDERKQLIRKLLWISVLPFVTSFYLCKAALLSVYHQVIPRFMTKRRTFLWATVSYVVASFVVTIVLLFTICTPVSRWWTFDSDRQCHRDPLMSFFRAIWALNFTCDIFSKLLLSSHVQVRWKCANRPVFVLPWLIVPDLMIKGWLRIGIYFTFLLGLINMSLSIVRYTKVYTGVEASLVTIHFWNSLDLYIGLVIACLPALRPYFKYAAESRAFNYMRSKTGTRGSSQYTANATTASSHAAKLSQVPPKGSFDVSEDRLSQLCLVHVRPEDEERY